jgi:hypothetical protein
MRQLKITKSITNRESASLDKYLQEIGREELISAEEEVVLAKKIRDGDQSALEKLTNPKSLTIFTSKVGAEFILNNFSFRSYVKVRVVDSYWMKALRTYSSRSEVILKVDDDIFMSEDSWSSLLDQALIGDDATIYSPVVSTGVPSVELFMEQYLTESEEIELRALLAKVQFPEKLWSVDYTSLNGKYQEGYGEFLYSVANLRTDYLGIHPVRISHEAQALLLEHGLTALKRGIVREPNEDLELSSTYFCNNVFSIPRPMARRLLLGLLFRKFRYDGYDELGINWLLSEGGATHQILKKALALHPSFNSATGFELLRGEMMSRLEKLFGRQPK